MRIGTNNGQTKKIQESMSHNHHHQNHKNSKNTDTSHDSSSFYYNSSAIQLVDNKFNKIEIESPYFLNGEKSQDKIHNAMSGQYELV